MALFALSATLALHGGSVVRPALMRSPRPALMRSPPVAMQLFGRGRAKRAVEAPEQIAVGAALPDVVQPRLRLCTTASASCQPACSTPPPQPCQPSVGPAWPARPSLYP